MILFKGVPFTITDLSAADTAFLVAKEYEFKITNNLIIGTLILVSLIFVILFIKFEEINKVELVIFNIFFIFSFTILLLFACDKKTVKILGNINFYEKLGSFYDYGPLLNLYIDNLYSEFEVPKDYNLEESLEEIQKTVVDENINTKAKNIICILDESFYDLNEVTNLDENKDPLEFYNSLSKNTIKGKTVVSSFGGETANSEYEFLTNGNMGFLPITAYPFTKNIKTDINSIASILKDNGYKTISYHPFSKNTWNRIQIYDYLGFDEYYAYEDFYDEGYDGLLRGLVTDLDDIKDIIRMYENKEDGENLFIYNVTIQNHPGYSKYKELNSIYSNKYNDQSLSTYLTLVNLSDNAIKELVTYFDNIDEPTLICIFGDHIPGELELFADKSKTLEEKIKYYCTPYLIHTNYDIDTNNDYEYISLSYLSTLVMDFAGISKTKEQQYIQNFIKEYPIINRYFYGTKNNLKSIEEFPEDLKKWRDLKLSELSR